MLSNPPNPTVYSIISVFSPLRNTFLLADNTIRRESTRAFVELVMISVFSLHVTVMERARDDKSDEISES